jgi:hypothetical protein
VRRAEATWSRVSLFSLDAHRRVTEDHAANDPIQRTTTVEIRDSRRALARAIARYVLSLISVISGATTLVHLAEGQGAFSFELGLATAWWAGWLLVLPGLPLFLVLISVLPALARRFPRARIDLLAAAASVVIWLIGAAILIVVISIPTDPGSPSAPTIPGTLIVFLYAAVLGAIVGFVEGWARRRAASRAQ